MPRFNKTEAEWLAEADTETTRILALSPKEVMDEHLRMYGGDRKLAKRAIDLMRARILELVALSRKDH